VDLVLDVVVDLDRDVDLNLVSIVDAFVHVNVDD
jgi:hypothetical protein